MSRYTRLLSLAMLVVLTITLLPACGSKGSPAPPPVPPGPTATRSYNLAFTPFPYGLNQAAIDYTYLRISSDADMIADHLGAYGVPWPEAVADTFPYNAALMAEWETRRSRTRPGHRVYLALNPVSQGRNGIASLWDATGPDKPLPAPWNGYALNDPQVKIAFLNYARRAIAYFNPDYVTLGIEANQIMTLNPSVWPMYVDLHRAVYLSLKSIYPTLPIMVSLDAGQLLGYVNANAADQARARTEIAAYSDYFCLSLYPYLGSNAGGSFPADMFDRLAGMTSKPIAICETGYPSQGFTLRAPNTPAVRADPTAQRAFLERLFQAADQASYRFIVYFFLRDLDEALDFSDIIRTFRYDGLYTTTGAEKPALAVWKAKLSLTKRALAPEEGSLDPAQSDLPDPPDAPWTAWNPTGDLGAQAGTFVYTNDNVNGPNGVSAFSIGAGGTLTRVPGSPFATGGTGNGLWGGTFNDIAVAPQGFLYAANQQSGDVSAFSIDTATGAITPVRGMPFRGGGWGQTATALAVDPRGRLLAAANARTRTVTTFDIGADGSLLERGRAVEVGGRPTMLRISPDGRLLAGALDNDGRVAVVSIDADGALSVVAGSPFAGQFVNATTVDFECGASHLYAANGALGSRADAALDVFHVETSGSLALLGGSSWPALGANAGLIVSDPLRHLLFMATQGIGGDGGRALTTFRATEGSLSQVTGSPISVGSSGLPVGLTTTAGGEFLLMANYPEVRSAPGSVSVFAVGPGGALAAAPGSPTALPGTSVTSVATYPPPRCLP